MRVTGSGPDVLLIPGLASSGATWDDTVKQLTPHYRCHVFTLAGFAGVPAQPGPLLDDVDAALANYIEQKHLKSPIVVGHSLGGFIALKLAIDHPATSASWWSSTRCPRWAPCAWTASRHSSCTISRRR